MDKARPFPKTLLSLSIESAKIARMIRMKPKSHLSSQRNFRMRARAFGSRRSDAESLLHGNSCPFALSYQDIGHQDGDLFPKVLLTVPKEAGGCGSTPTLMSRAAGRAEWAGPSALLRGLSRRTEVREQFRVLVQQPNQIDHRFRRDNRSGLVFGESLLFPPPTIAAISSWGPRGYVDKIINISHPSSRYRPSLAISRPLRAAMLTAG